MMIDPARHARNTSGGGLFWAVGEMLSGTDLLVAEIERLRVLKHEKAQASPRSNITC